MQDCTLADTDGMAANLAAHPVLGGGLPPAAEAHLRLAGLAYHIDRIAEDHLQAARDIAPEHEAVLIGFYRYYFYKHRLAEALEIGRICLSRTARGLNIAADWRDVRPGDAAFGSLDAILPRFYMFTLKGIAYLNMRLGRIEDGKAAASKLLDLDPSDRINAKLLLDIVARAEDAQDG